MADFYLNRFERRIGRRGLLRGAGTTAAGGAALALVGCGDDDDDDDATSTEESTSTAEPTSEPTDEPTSAATDTATAAPTTATEAPSAGGLGPQWAGGPGDQFLLSEDTFYTTTGQTAGGTFRWNNQYPGFSANPNRVAAGDAHFVLVTNMGLYKGYPNGSVVLHAAESVEEIDELTWNVTIRPDIVFHNIPPVNGRTMTTEDVVFSFGEAVPDVQSPYGRWNNFIESWTAVDEQVVQFKSKLPYSARLEVNPVTITAPEVVDAIDRDKLSIGIGPYMIDGEYNPQGVTNLVRHEGFFQGGGRPFPDKIEYTHIFDPAAAQAGILSGQIDIDLRPFPKQVADELASSIDAEVVEFPFLAPGLIWINSGKFADARIRQAVALAVDRKRLVDTILFGIGGATAPVPPGLTGWTLPQDEVDEFYYYNDHEAGLAEARALLEAAGGGEALGELRLMAPTDIQDFLDSSPLIAQDLTDAGFQITEVALPAVDIVSTHFFPGDFELVFSLWAPFDDIANHLVLYAGPTGGVPGLIIAQGGSEQVDNLILQTLASFDAEERVELTYETQRAIMSEAINRIPVWAQISHTPVPTHIKDYAASSSYITNMQADYWIES
jgi:peptide/nickel transport system substrate-binding protein